MPTKQETELIVQKILDDLKSARPADYKKLMSVEAQLIELRQMERQSRAKVNPLLSGKALVDARLAFFGDDAYRIPISATKAIHGHLLGASGALELVLSLLSMQHHVLLPTMHLQFAAEDCDLDYVPNRARHDVKIGAVMSNSFAFGGTNAVLVARSCQ